MNPKPVAIVQKGTLNEQAASVLAEAGYSVVFVHDVDGVVIPHKTLRDEFAMAALQGMYAGHACTTDGDTGSYAKAAFAIADAMLEERDAPAR
mgnify:FL=1